MGRFTVGFFSGFLFSVVFLSAFGFCRCALFIRLRAMNGERCSQGLGRGLVRRWLWLAAPLLLFTVVDQTEGIKRLGKITLYTLDEWADVRRRKIVALSPILRRSEELLAKEIPGLYRTRERTFLQEPEFMAVPYIELVKDKQGKVQKRRYIAVLPMGDKEAIDRYIAEQAKYGYGEMAEKEVNAVLREYGSPWAQIRWLVKRFFMFVLFLCGWPLFALVAKKLRWEVPGSWWCCWFAALGLLLFLGGSLRREWEFFGGVGVFLLALAFYIRGAMLAREFGSTALRVYSSGMGVLALSFILLRYGYVGEEFGVALGVVALAHFLWLQGDES